MTTQTRRSFLKCVSASLLPATPAGAERLGIMCQFDPDENSARNVLASARKAGFRRAQINFPWDRATTGFLKQLPAALRAEDVRADAVSVYVNCADPENVLMNARAEDLGRAADLASSVGATRLVAWTGGYGKGLMTAHPRNSLLEACDNICRFLETWLKELESGRLTLALESYITLACPDGPSLRRLLDRLPSCVTAVMDPPNLTPVARYRDRDQVLAELFKGLSGRIGIVHLKDFRLARDGVSYELPGPLKGEMNYPLLVEQLRRLPPDIPWIAEHLAPAEFAGAYRGLTALL